MILREMRHPGHWLYLETRDDSSCYHCSPIGFPFLRAPACLCDRPDCNTEVLVNSALNQVNPEVPLRKIR